MKTPHSQFARAVPAWFAVSAGLLFSFGLPLIAQSQPESGFFERSAEGWFWYQDPVLSEAVELAPVPGESASGPDPEDIPFSTAWLQKQMPIWHAKAIDDPHGPAMRVHLMLERMVIAKADAYANARMALTYSDPFLSATSGTPTSTAGVMMSRSQAKDGRARVLAELAENTGVWFFYESTCPFCARQVFALEQLADIHGFTLYPISIDGHPLPNLNHDYVIDQGQSEMLGVTSWPTLFIARPPNEFAHIASGLVSLPEIESRIIAVASSHGWITPEQQRDTISGGHRQPVLASAAGLERLEGQGELSEAELMMMLNQTLTAGAKP